MRRKTLWLLLWMTLAFWAGCAAEGENRNYEMNREESPLLEEGYPTQSRAPASGAGRIPGSLRPMLSDAPPPARVEAATAAEPMAARKPKLIPAQPRPAKMSVRSDSLSRRNWPTVVIGPERGATAHYPAYLGSQGSRFDRPSPLGGSRVNFSDQIIAATSGYRYDIALRDVTHIVIDPLKATKGFVLLPVEFVRRPPWALQVTPEQ